MQRALATTENALHRAVADTGAPGITAEIRADGDTWFGTAGKADTATGRVREQAERFRIGSTTKTFVATVVLQLVAEGRLSLDDTVERHLPSVVTGNGNDGRAVTVRQLLNHTSGIFNYSNDPKLFTRYVGPAFLEHRYDSITPEQLVKVAMEHPPAFEPGSAFSYSNTNYALAGMIAERITGNSLSAEISRRISAPLGLTGTYLPGEEAEVRGPHPRHYSTLFATTPDPEIYDVTEMNQSSTWAAGGMVSTVGDLNRFYQALMAGQLLPPAQQRAMFTTVPTDGSGWIPDTEYGLGVFAQRLPCGTTVWGNGGATFGSWTYAMGTRDGGHRIAANVNGDWSGLGVFNDVLNAEFCQAPGGDQPRG
jgi:D-alanyl-D-alanine carboxypeptidase